MDQRLKVAAGISVSIFALNLAVYFLFSADQKSTQSRVPLAYIKELSGDLKFLDSEKQVWRELSENDLIYSGMRIRTSENSRSEIVFSKTDDAILLEPETTMVLLESSGESSVQVENGSIQMAQPIGNLKVKDSEGKELKIADDGSIGVSKDAKDNKGTWSWLAPKTDLEIESEEPQSEYLLPTEWQTSQTGKVEFYIGETAVSLKKTHTLPAEGLAFRLPLRNGTSYIQARFVSESNGVTKYGPTIKVKVSSAQVLKTKMPMWGQVEILTEGQTLKMPLAWEASEAYEKFKVFLKNQSDNKEIEKLVSGARNLEVEINKAGKYSWWVKGFNEKKQQWSQTVVSEFEIEEKLIALKKLAFESSQKLPAQLANGEIVTVNWDYKAKEDRPDRNPIFEVSYQLSEDKSSAVKKQLVAEYVYSFTPDKSGNYTISVRGINADGSDRTEVITQQLKVDVAQASRWPASTPVIQIKELSEDSVQLSWLPPSSWSKFEYTLAKANQVVAQKSVEATELLFEKLAPGQYQFSMRAKDKADRYVPETQYISFEISSVSRIAPPKIKALEVDP